MHIPFKSQYLFVILQHQKIIVLPEDEKETDGCRSTYKTSWKVVRTLVLISSGQRQIIKLVSFKVMMVPHKFLPVNLAISHNMRVKIVRTLFVTNNTFYVFL